MKNQVDPVRTTPWTMFTDAKHYRVAAGVLMDRATADDAGTLIKVQLIMPVMTLISMSVESALKSYLYASGVDPNILKSNYGHDLVRLRDEVERRSDGQIRSLVQEVARLLDMLNPPYKGKEFQYRAIGEMRVPLPARLCDWIMEFIDAIRPFVREKDDLHCKKHGVQIEPPEE